MKRHTFSLGTECDVCDSCLTTVRESNGVSGECPGPKLTDREQQLIAAALRRGYKLGTAAASAEIRKLYALDRAATAPAGPSGRALQMYRCMQRIGDLKLEP